jgi:hypothetical protein
VEAVGSMIGIVSDGEIHGNQEIEETDTANLMGYNGGTSKGRKGPSGVAGNPTHEAIKKKVLGVLSSLRQRFDQPKIEIKQELFQQIHQFGRKGKVTKKELRDRVELLFDEIR